MNLLVNILDLLSGYISASVQVLVINFILTNKNIRISKGLISKPSELRMLLGDYIRQGEVNATYTDSKYTNYE